EVLDNGRSADWLKFKKTSTIHVSFGVHFGESRTAGRQRNRCWAQSTTVQRLPLNDTPPLNLSRAIVKKAARRKNAAPGKKATNAMMTFAHFERLASNERERTFKLGDLIKVMQRPQWRALNLPLNSPPGLALNFPLNPWAGLLIQQLTSGP